MMLGTPKVIYVNNEKSWIISLLSKMLDDVRNT